VTGAVTSANGSQDAPASEQECASGIRDAAWWWAWKGNGTGERVVTERQLTIFERAS
jgi:hypothetical protein